MLLGCAHELTEICTVFVNVFMWGVVVSCTAAAHNFNGLITTRFFLGIFEATVGMSCIIVTSRTSQ